MALSFTAKKRSILLRISSVNVTKSANSCGFVQICCISTFLHEKLHFLGSDLTKDNDQKLPTSSP